MHVDIWNSQQEKVMNIDNFIKEINTNELIEETHELIAWENGLAYNIDDLAKFIYQNGPLLPDNYSKKQRTLSSRTDNRPEKKYWYFVKNEMIAFVCHDEKKYEKLWERINSIENKSTTAFVATISAYIGEKAGVDMAILSGFVAVCLYGLSKIGKEALCTYLQKDYT